MSTQTFDIWNTKKVLVGYSTDFGGLFRYHNPQDMEHYAAVGGAFGFAPEQMVRVRQKHTNRVVLVDAGNAGEGVVRVGEREAADGMITASANVVLCVVTADCVPVFLYDETHGAIGMVHSGRTGTAADIVAVAVRSMQRHFGSRPNNIQCILGPALCAKHHEVELEHVAAFERNFTPQEQAAFIERREGKAYVDMAGAIRLSLARSGLQAQNIYDCGICTYEQSDLFSWRRDHIVDARILSFVAMRKV